MNRLTLIIFSVSYLSACSSGGGDNASEVGDVGVDGSASGESGVLVQFGLEGSELQTDQIPGLDKESSSGFYTGTFYLERDGDDGGTNILAQFGNSSRRPQAIRSLLDTCGYGRGGREFYFDIGGGNNNVGDQVLFSSDSGTFTTIAYTSFYAKYLPDILDLPESLNVSIPDAPFSTPISLPVPVANSLQWTSPTTVVELNTNSVLRWMPGDSQQSYIKVNIDLEIEGPLSTLSCIMVDDGEFSLSSDPTAGFFLNEPALIRLMDAERIGVRFIGSGDAAFELYNSYRISVID